MSERDESNKAQANKALGLFIQWIIEKLKPIVWPKIKKIFRKKDG